MRYPVALGAFCLAIAAIAVGPAGAASADASGWEIGPDVRGRNYSVGMPLQPTPAGRKGWSFEFPYPHAGVGHVHAVTYRAGPLINASKIVMRYRIDASPRVRFAPQETPDQPATVSIYFQRYGDNWSGKRQYEFYRWYAPAQTVKEVARGEYEVTVSLSDPNWISVMGRPAATNPRAFEAALAQTDRIGIAFGSASARAHGVYSTNSARFTLIEFSII